MVPGSQNPRDGVEGLQQGPSTQRPLIWPGTLGTAWLPPVPCAHTGVRRRGTSSASMVTEGNQEREGGRELLPPSLPQQGDSCPRLSHRNSLAEPRSHWAPHPSRFDFPALKSQSRVLSSCDFPTGAPCGHWAVGTRAAPVLQTVMVAKAIAGAQGLPAGTTCHLPRASH